MILSWKRKWMLILTFVVWALILNLTKKKNQKNCDNSSESWFWMYQFNHLVGDYWTSAPILNITFSVVGVSAFRLQSMQLKCFFQPQIHDDNMHLQTIHKTNQQNEHQKKTVTHKADSNWQFCWFNLPSLTNKFKISFTTCGNMKNWLWKLSMKKGLWIEIAVESNGCVTNRLLIVEHFTIDTDRLFMKNNGPWTFCCVCFVRTAFSSNQQINNCLSLRCPWTLLEKELFFVANQMKLKEQNTKSYQTHSVEKGKALLKALKSIAILIQAFFCANVTIRFWTANTSCDPFLIKNSVFHTDCCQLYPIQRMRMTFQNNLLCGQWMPITNNNSDNKLHPTHQQKELFFWFSINACILLLVLSFEYRLNRQVINCE